MIKIVNERNNINWKKNKDNKKKKIIKSLSNVIEFFWVYLIKSFFFSLSVSASIFAGNEPSETYGMYKQWWHNDKNKIQEK